MRLETRFCTRLREPHNGLGAPQARPRAFSRRVAPKARSGKRLGVGPSRVGRGAERGSWAPASDGAGGPRGRSPPDPVSHESKLTSRLRGRWLDVLEDEDLLTGLHQSQLPAGDLFDGGRILA